MSYLAPVQFILDVLSSISKIGRAEQSRENAGEGKLRNYSYQLIFSFLHGVDMEKLIMKM